MKYPAFILSILIICCLSACYKGSVPDGPIKKTYIIGNATLPGKWKVIGNMISSGGPMYFVAAPGTDYVNFNTNGTLSGSAFPNFKTYTVKDTVRLTMTSADNSTYEDYFYKISADTLKLGMAGPYYCIEGCAVVLLKE